MALFLFALSALIMAYSAAAYLLGVDVVLKGTRAAYREMKHVLGTVARRGWRPYIPWCFGALLSVIVARLALGLPLPDVGTLSVLLGPLGAITAHAVQVRSGDYRAGVANEGAYTAPTGGLTNNVAIS